jgi:hypothetical protein
LDQLRRSAEFGQVSLDYLIKVSHVSGHEIGHSSVLQMAPYHLNRVEVGGVSWQSLQVQPGIPGQQLLADQRAFVVAAAIPDHDRPASQMAEKLAQEGDNSRRVDVVFRVGLPVQANPAAAWSDRDGRNCGDLVAVSPEAGQGRGRASRCPGPSGQRVEEETALVDQDEVGLLVPGLFLMRGQSSAPQQAIAGSFRSMARTWGFCGLRPM